MQCLDRRIPDKETLSREVGKTLMISSALRFRRFNSEMQQAVTAAWQSDRWGKAGGAKGLSPEVMRAKRAPFAPPAFGKTSDPSPAPVS